MSKPFTHALDEEFRSISGYYVFLKEEVIEVAGSEILFLLGEGQAETACCGSGGCRYALVPGKILAWKSTIDEQGRAVSLIDPLGDPEIKSLVRQRIKETEAVDQVQFW
jgi:hypothetical protein